MKISLRTRKGFTLLELLTAVAITTVIIAALIGMTRMSMDAWKESSDRARASRLAKESLEVMAKDFEGMVLRTGNDYQWLYTKMDANVELGPSSAEIENPLDMAFFTAATDRYDGDLGPNSTKDEGGDISTVFYRLIYKDQFDGDFKVYSLYRHLVNPDETFENHLALKDGDDDDDAEGLENSAPTESVVTNAENFLAENVYNITVTYVFEVLNTTTSQLETVRVPVMSDQGGFNEISITGSEVTVSPNEIKDSNGNTVTNVSRLVSVELGVLVLSDSAMNTLKHQSFTSDKFNEFVKSNSHYFTKSVILPRP
ncbi:type II secretion system protein J [Rubritalea spongiae]|uniref:Type II secretion system protein J n=1 Tax=Rubritalea spongiae TaxID=430797 RepID=A0ABW5E002_9BACT